MPPRRVTKRPTAQKKIKRANTELLSQQILSQSQRSQTRSQDDNERPSSQRQVTQKSFMSQSESLFTPKKRSAGIELEEEDPTASDSSVQSDSSESEKSEATGIDYNSKFSISSVNKFQQDPLTTYEAKLPKVTKNWRPLPNDTFTQIKQVLTYLLPSVFTKMNDHQQFLITKNLLNPLFKRLKHIALPNLQPEELNLKVLENDLNYINECYSQSLTQLDDLLHESIKQEQILNDNTKYVSDFKKRVANFKSQCNTQLDQLIKKSNCSIDKGILEFPKEKNLSQTILVNGVDDSILDDRLKSMLKKLDSTLDLMQDHSSVNNKIFSSLNDY